MHEIPSDLVLLKEDTLNETYLYVGSFDPPPVKIKYDGEEYWKLGWNHLNEVIYARAERTDKPCQQSLWARLMTFFSHKPLLQNFLA